MRGDGAPERCHDFALLLDHFGEVDFDVGGVLKRGIETAGGEAGGEFEDLGGATVEQQAGDGFESGFEERGVAAKAGEEFFGGRVGVALKGGKNFFGEGDIGVFGTGDYGA